MKQAFLLKTLCVLSAYLAIQQFISFFIFFEQRNSAYAILAICAVSVFLCCCLHHKKFLKFIPLLLLGFSAFFIQNTADFFLFVPCWIYCIFIVARDNFEVDHARFQRFFKLCNIAVVILIFLALIVAVFNPLNEVIIFALIYFAFGITLKRAIRHGGIVLQNPFFALLNVSTSVLFVAAVLFISYPAVVQTLFRLVTQALYYIFVFPIVFIMQLIMPLLNIIELGTINFMRGRRSQVLGVEVDSPEFGIYRTYIDVWQDALNFDLPMAYTLGIVLIMLMLTLVFIPIFRKRKFLHDFFAINKKPEATATGFHLKYTESTSKRKLSQLLDTNYIRRYYRRFLKLCVDKGVILSTDSTSATIARDAKTFIKDEANIDQLREVYIKSRYSGKEDTKEDKAKAKDTYLRIKGGYNNLPFIIIRHLQKSP